MKFYLITLIFFTVSLSSFAQQKLLLIGGGKRPLSALKMWVGEKRLPSTQLMVITWASEIQSEVEAAIQADFKKIGVKKFFSSREILNLEHKKTFLNQLKKSTHVFFSGGDQKRILKVIKDPEIHAALNEAYWNKGVPVAGTSAGTAIQAELMIQGPNLPLTKGLGFLPKSVTDQHFFKRNREARLRAALQEAPVDFVGVGVDEDGAILFKRRPDTHQFVGQVIGDKNVLYISPLTEGVRKERILLPFEIQELLSFKSFTSQCLAVSHSVL